MKHEVRGFLYVLSIAAVAAGPAARFAGYTGVTFYFISFAGLILLFYLERKRAS